MSGKKSKSSPMTSEPEQPECQSPEIDENASPDADLPDADLTDVDLPDSDLPQHGPIPGYILSRSEHAEVLAYLELGDPQEMAMLAAAMAPRAEAFDPPDLMKMAFALKAEAKAELLRRREEMVSTMNFGMLEAILLNRKRLDDLFMQQLDSPILDDPVVGPVIRQSRKMIPVAHLYDVPKSDFPVENCTQQLEDADKRTDRPRPALPCSIESALRYSAAVPKGATETLRQAFLNFLMVYPIRSADEQRSYEIYESQYDPSRLILYAKKLADIPQDHPERPGLVEEMNSLQSWFDNLETVRNFREHFSPGSVAPEEVQSEAELTLEDYWDTTRRSKVKSITTEAQLAWFATHFHAFWEEHGAYYRKKAETFQRSGNQGAPTRDRQVWGKRTKDFIASKAFQEFLKKTRAGEKREDFATVAKAFISDHGKLKDRRTQKKVAFFLDQLFNHIDSVLTDNTLGKIMRGLKQESITAMNFETIRDCHGLLKAALGKA